MSIVIVYSDPSKEVSIAGNFTNWSPQKLIFKEGRYEYTVTPSDQTGKLSFKFIVDGNWITDQNFASEFDEMGNENNVIIYDYTKEKTLSKERDVSSEKEVEFANKQAPSTPDPTPMNASPSNLTPSTTANQTPQNDESTVASKTLPKTAAPPQPAVTQGPTTKVIPSEVSKPQPVARPSIPKPTEAPPSITPLSSKSPEPLPSQVPGSFDPILHSPTSDNASVATINSRNGIVREDAPKDWNLFANLLHLIAEFFKNWLRRGAAA